MPPASTPAQPPPGKRNRNAFVRTKVSITERIISVVIVALLAGIGIAIWIKGHHFDPGLYSLRTDALASTEKAVDGKAGTLRIDSGVQPGEESVSKAQPSASATPMAAPAPSGDTASNSDIGEGGGEGTASAHPAVQLKQEPLEVTVSGVKPMGATEFYNADTLYEKIDGRSPAYTGFNFQQLRNRSFSVDGAGGSYVDLYEFRMDSPVNAFGIFALERDPNGKALDFAADGYSGEMGYFFRQGSIYVQVLASDQNPKTLAAAKAIAMERAKAIPVDDAGLDGRRKLPAEGMIADSVTFTLDNAQGQEFLKQVWQASYQYNGVKLPFFLMVATPQAAADAWNAYQTFSAKFGKTEALPDVKGAKIFQVQTFGKWKIIFQRDGVLGGVVDADDPAKGRQFVEAYLQGQIK